MTVESPRVLTVGRRLQILLSIVSYCGLMCIQERLNQGPMTVAYCIIYTKPVTADENLVTFLKAEKHPTVFLDKVKQ